MVSTRSVKFKFVEGEKVLCYEPDPAKTKVLYNSKVLEVCVKKDGSGKKVAHFLIHFQGWNSTWDRFVTEDFILKDTEDNRKLQRELAEKAQLTASCGNLYRKDRKKRSVLASSSPKSRLSPPVKDNLSTVEQTVNSHASSPASSSGAKAGVKRRHSSDDIPHLGSNNHCGDEPSDNEGSVSARPATIRSSHFSVSPALRNWLDKDHDRIKLQNKLVKLPADPTAIEVLQKWMIDYSLSQIKLICHKRGHLRPSAGKKGSIVTVDSIARSSNLCREVADSLRVFMEFGLSRMFLYEEEKLQHSHILNTRESNSRFRTESPIDIEDECDVRYDEKSHKAEYEADSGDDGESRRKSLRSHSSVSNHSQDPDVKPDLATLLANDCLNDGGEILALRPMSFKEKEALKKILSRKLVTNSYRDQKHPSTVYGAIHLSRVLVKMPQVLANAEYGEPKLSLLVEYLNNFMRYLEDHSEWFTEHHYIERPPISS